VDGAQVALAVDDERVPVSRSSLEWAHSTLMRAVEFPRFSGHLMACECKPRKDGVHHAEDPTRVSG
jgi:hypothetical protein